MGPLDDDDAVVVAVVVEGRRRQADHFWPLVTILLLKAFFVGIELLLLRTAAKFSAALKELLVVAN